MKGKTAKWAKSRSSSRKNKFVKISLDKGYFITEGDEMKHKITGIGMAVIFLAGAILFLYPTISKWYEEKQNDRRIEEFGS